VRRIFIAVAFGALLALSACQTSKPSGDVGRGPADNPDTRLVARDNTFDHIDIVGKTGEVMVVEVANLGETNHEFRIEDLGLSTGTIEPGETAHARFRVPRGVTEFQCSYHGGMSGVVKGT
jgi:plastocyanin